MKALMILSVVSGIVEPGLGAIRISRFILSVFLPVLSLSREKIAYFTRAKISIPSLPADDV